MPERQVTFVNYWRLQYLIARMHPRTKGTFDGSGAGAAAVALGAQPAVVKIVSAAGGPGRVRALMTYVGTRESAPEAGKGQADRRDIPLRDERGHLVLGAAAREGVLASWEESFEKRTLSRDVGR